MTAQDRRRSRTESNRTEGKGECMTRDREEGMEEPKTIVEKLSVSIFIYFYSILFCINALFFWDAVAENLLGLRPKARG